MPWGDGTGPRGLGPMTGRGAGYCAGYGVPGYMNPYGGRYWGRGGFGLGFGRGGWGYRNMYYLTGLPGWARYGYATPFYGYGAGVDPETAKNNEKTFLKNEAELLRNNLANIEKRLSDLESEESEN